MFFEKTIGMKDIDKAKNLKRREAVRGVILRNDKLLLVHSNLGDYKFPGGGIENGETHIEALVREIAEETGYINTVVNEKAGVVVEQREDIFEGDAIFSMDSHYYFCEVTGERSEQQLDGYEADQEYTPEWIAIEKAIEQNDTALAAGPEKRWIHRENFVLKKLLKLTAHQVHKG